MNMKNKNKTSLLLTFSLLSLTSESENVYIRINYHKIGGLQKAQSSLEYMSTIALIQ